MLDTSGTSGYLLTMVFFGAVVAIMALPARIPHVILKRKYLKELKRRKELENIVENYVHDPYSDTEFILQFLPSEYKLFNIIGKSIPDKYMEEDGEIVHFLLSDRMKQSIHNNIFTAIAMYLEEKRSEIRYATSPIKLSLINDNIGETTESKTTI